MNKKRKTDDTSPTNIEKVPLFRLYRFLHLSTKQSLIIQASPRICAAHLQTLQSKDHHVMFNGRETQAAYEFDISVETSKRQMRRHVVGTIYSSAEADMSLVTLHVYPSAVLLLFGGWPLFLLLTQLCRILPLMALHPYTMTRGDSAILCFPITMLFVWFFSYQMKQEALALASDHLLQLNKNKQGAS